MLARMPNASAFPVSRSRARDVIRDTLGVLDEVTQAFERRRHALGDALALCPVSYTHLDVYKRQVK